MKQYLDQTGVEYLWDIIQRNFANLSNGGKVPASQLPSYVDDVVEYGTLSSFPTEGEEGKIYVAKDTNLTYRWSGTGYIEISASLALGTTSDTAYPGDKGVANENAISNEVQRAKAEESDIRAALETEINRAQTAERHNDAIVGQLQEDLTSETNKRAEKDDELASKIAAEVSDRTEADTVLENKITKEITDRQNAINEVKTTVGANLNSHITNYNNPHKVTKAQIDLGNVDNTSDLNKPISNATQLALDKKADANKYLPLTGGELTGNLTSPKYIKTGGTGQQVLLADGTTATTISQDTLNLILV